MAEANFHCGCEQLATQFCLCSSKPVFLCKACLFKHLVLPNRNHCTYDIKAFSNKDIPGYLDRLSVRTEKLEDIHKSLQARHHAVGQQIDDCKRDLQAKVDSAIQGLTRYLKAKTDELDELKGKIFGEWASAISEVEAKMYEPNPPLEGHLAQALWQTDPWSVPEMKFDYLIRTTDNVESSVILDFHYASGDEQWPVLPQVYMKQLKLFNARSKRATVYSLPINFIDGSVYCLTTAKTLLCVSGLSPTKAAKIVNLEDSVIRNVANMIDMRLRPGIIKYGNAVFAFGGGTVTFEKFNIEEEAWHYSNSAVMQTEKSCFSPCAYKGRIYLPEFRQSQRKVEYWDVTKESFGEVLLPLTTDFSGSSVSFTVADTLYVFATSFKLLKVNMSTGVHTGPVAVKMPGDDSNNAYSIIPPMVFTSTDGREKNAYWVKFDGVLVKFDINTQSLANY